MKKFLKYTLAIAAALSTLSSCSNNEDRIFDSSAADRLDEAKLEYADLLTRDGGIWVMEYFANEDMAGYSYVMKFGKDGSVEMSTNNDQLGNSFRQETSLWDIISDDGVVLTFNSYNSLFHIFAEPDATTGDGMLGDYEFIFLGTEDDGNVINLKGKKHHLPIVMRRLPADVDVAAFVDGFAKQASSMFNGSINRAYLIHGATGERFVISDAYTGVLAIYPEGGDAVLQTEYGNFIRTAEGIRFMRPLSVSVAASQTDSLTFNKFLLQPDGTLLCDDGEEKPSMIVGDPLEVVFANQNYLWRVDTEATHGFFKNFIDQLIADVPALPSGKFVAFDFVKYVSGTEESKTGYALDLVISSRAGTTPKTVTYNYLFNAQFGENSVKLTYKGTDGEGTYLLGKLPVVQTLIDYLNGRTLKLSSENMLAPSVMKVSATDTDYIITKVQ